MNEGNRSSSRQMYYIALLCPPEVNERIQQFKLWMKEQFGCVIALRSPAHITLVPPFWFGEEREHALLTALYAFKSGKKELQIELNGFAHFGKKVLFIQVNSGPELNEMKNLVNDHFIQSFPGKIKKDGRPFHPHVTIATRDMSPGHFFKAWGYFFNKKFAETFSVHVITLLKLSPGKWNVIGGRDWVQAD